MQYYFILFICIKILSISLSDLYIKFSENWLLELFEIFCKIIKIKNKSWIGIETWLYLKNLWMWDTMMNEK